MTPKRTTITTPRRYVEPRPFIPVQGRIELVNTFVKEIHHEAAPGETLAAIVGRVTSTPSAVRVHIVSPSGLVHGPIPPSQWERIRPRLGRRVVLRVVPQGSGSGNKDRDTVTILHLIGVIALSFVPGVGPILAIVVNIAGQILINEMFPPSTPGKAKALTGQKDREHQSETLSITGSQNRAYPYGPMPVIYGQHGVFPPWR